MAGALADADSLFEGGEPLPTGSDLHARIVRARMEERQALADAEWEEATRFDAAADAATKAAFALFKAGS